VHRRTQPSTVELSSSCAAKEDGDLHTASAHSGSLLVAVLVAVRSRSRLSAGVRSTGLSCAAAFREPRRTWPGQAFNPWVQGSSPWRPTCEKTWLVDLRAWDE
jgi:hypothetical protein